MIGYEFLHLRFVRKIVICGSSHILEIHLQSSDSNFYFLFRPNLRYFGIDFVTTTGENLVLGSLKIRFFLPLEIV
ncbi:hypothetical protein LEP1GSC170_0445 [Leptospira interrogans serovar Bataviae str. HAI135]|nr:hypothetical protein LEP1GSC170_0445 [Leptospira interrogans serovar Bataviae str. HAI135]